MCLFFIVIVLTLLVERSAAFPGEKTALLMEGWRPWGHGTWKWGPEGLPECWGNWELPIWHEAFDNKPRSLLSNERSAGVGWRTTWNTRLHRNLKKKKQTTVKSKVDLLQMILRYKILHIEVYCLFSIMLRQSVTHDSDKINSIIFLYNNAGLLRKASNQTGNKDRDNILDGSSRLLSAHLLEMQFCSDIRVCL